MEYYSSVTYNYCIVIFSKVYFISGFWEGPAVLNDWKLIHHCGLMFLHIFGYGKKQCSPYPWYLKGLSQGMRHWCLILLLPITCGGEDRRQHLLSISPMKRLQCIRLCTEKEVHIDLTFLKSRVYCKVIVIWLCINHMFRKAMDWVFYVMCFIVIIVLNFPYGVSNTGCNSYIHNHTNIW